MRSPAARSFATVTEPDRDEAAHIQGSGLFSRMPFYRYDVRKKRLAKIGNGKAGTGASAPWTSVQLPVTIHKPGNKMLAVLESRAAIVWIKKDNVSPYCGEGNGMALSAVIKSD
ncbi:hypothetical protein GCM10007905_23760 [Mixta theicola]|nr:hypothetical protein GCM10007905_23760 [Mixta theicola]